jgi:hypothetical protein
MMKESKLSLSDYLKEQLNANREDKTNESVIPIIAPATSSVAALIGYFVLCVTLFSEGLYSVYNSNGLEYNGINGGPTWKSAIKTNGLIIGTIIWVYEWAESKIDSIRYAVGQKRFDSKKEELLKDPDIQAFIRSPKKYKRLKDIMPILERHNMKDSEFTRDMWRTICRIRPDVRKDVSDAKDVLESIESL